MSVEEYYRGEKGSVCVFVTRRGDAPAADFIDALDEHRQKKVIRLLKEFADRGEILNKERFRREDESIFAFKSGQVRILCFFLPHAGQRTIVLTHGFKKKQQKLSRSELAKAQRICEETTASQIRKTTDEAD